VRRRTDDLRRAVGRLESEIRVREGVEAELREASRRAEAANEAKSAFLANMSHEIRTPMTAILGFADLLLEPGCDGSMARDAAATIRRNGRHLIEIINDILDISKIEAGRMRVERIEIDLPEMVADVIELMQVRAEGKGIELRVEVHGPLPRRIDSDPVRLRQILVNLVGNAIKFTERGSVRLELVHETGRRDALAIAAGYFRDPRVGAVGGTLRVRNIGRSLATGVQHVNYAFSITLGRIVKDMLGFYFVASGAFGMYRTAAVRAVGGWDFGPGEDGDIVTRLRLAGWRARFAPFAVAMTEVPATFVKLGRQRLRWDRSMIRNRYRKAGPYVLDPRNANFDTAFAVSFLDIFFFNGLVPFLFLVYGAYLAGVYGPFAATLLLSVQLFYISAGLLKYLIALSVSTRPREDLRYLAFVPLYSLINVYFLRFVRLYATANELVARGSYTDPYVPAKVRARVRRY